jgi:hypothetical protein
LWKHEANNKVATINHGLLKDGHHKEVKEVTVPSIDYNNEVVIGIVTHVFNWKLVGSNITGVIKR